MTMHNDGLTKLIEECGELITECAKKAAYPNTDEHPDGKGSMKKRMEDEIADVKAAIAFVEGQFGLDADAIWVRASKKLALYRQWHADPAS